MTGSVEPDDLVTWQEMARRAQAEISPGITVTLVKAWGKRGVLGEPLRPDLSPPVYQWSVIKPLMSAQLVKPRSVKARARTDPARW